MSKLFAIAAVFVGYWLVGGQAVAADRTCTPNIAWSGVPSAIRVQIVKLVGGEVSPQDGPFNATDVVADNTPRARFFGACQEADQWAIAVERGGIAHYIEVFQFSDGALTDKWNTFVPRRSFTPAALERPHER